LVLSFALVVASLFVVTPRLVKADPGNRALSTQLTGAAELHQRGDPDGRGVAYISLDQIEGEICFKLEVEGIAAPTAAGIYVATAGVAEQAPTGPAPARPAVAHLAPPTRGSSQGCVAADTRLIQALRYHPESFYVNIYNAEFPAGAIGGQLGKSGASNWRLVPKIKTCCQQ
jgi:hypothetical protein